MTPLPFDKYHGLGNDFVVVGSDARVGDAEARALCDRHFGVGADGVLLVGPARSPGARAQMSIINADGSRPEMCGNGLRCVALHLAEADGLDATTYVVDTDAGPLTCVVQRDGGEASVRIAMGRAVDLGEMPFDLDGVSYEFRRMTIGNPHAITFEHPADLATIDRVGPALSASLPGGSNVEFVRALSPGRFELVVWERGVGRTLACGTGAAATAAALALTGRAPFDAPIALELPGGPLRLEVHEADLSVDLEGPAKHVFSGRWTP